MWSYLHKLTSPRYFYTFSGCLLPWLGFITAALFAYGLVAALYIAPPDYQQGDAFRIIYVHVPSAFISLGVYTFMTIAAIVAYIWKIKLANIAVKVSAPIGAWFTVAALASGSLWGKPMWGTYWVWDARLTSELILLFIYLAIIGLQNAIPDQNAAARAVRILVIVGFVNIPIIHYSVYWWNTLHQGDTINVFGQSLIAPTMLGPLWAMMIAFSLFFVIILFMRMRTEILMRERKTQWVQGILDQC